MTMTRSKIEDARAEAGRFIRAADKALDQLDLEAKQRDERYDELSKRGYDGPRPGGGPTPFDYSYGSKETGALRRASLDLTRNLAELRK